MSSDLASFTCPLPITTHKQVVLGHGGGGKLSQQLIQKFILPHFQNELLDPLHDGAIFAINGSSIAFSTDSFVVNPIFFPGGDIGTLAVHGTVNDLSMCGARPLYMTAAFIIEEGFPLEHLWRVVESMQLAAKAAGVTIVTGDTKVIDRGPSGRDAQIFINTSGIGLVPEGVNISPRNARPGDKIIINGPIAQHGMAIMSVRDGLEFETQIASDTAALNSLVETMFATTKDIHVLRDPTRGGVSSALNEIAQSACVGVRLDESRLPINEQVKAACEILGLDPLYVANEGKLLAFVPPEQSHAMLGAMRKHPLGRESTIVGEVVNDMPGFVTMKTKVGGERLVEMLSGEQLPRIC